QPRLPHRAVDGNAALHGLQREVRVLSHTLQAHAVASGGMREGDAETNKAAGQPAALSVSARQPLPQRQQPCKIRRTVRRVGTDGLAYLRRARGAEHFTPGLMRREAGGVEGKLAEREPERAEALVVAVVLGHLGQVVAVMHAVPEQVAVAGEAGLHRIAVAVDDL